MRDLRPQDHRRDAGGRHVPRPPARDVAIPGRPHRRGGGLPRRRRPGAASPYGLHRSPPAVIDLHTHYDGQATWDREMAPWISGTGSPPPSWAPEIGLRPRPTGRGGPPRRSHGGGGGHWPGAALLRHRHSLGLAALLAYLDAVDGDGFCPTPSTCSPTSPTTRCGSTSWASGRRRGGRHPRRRRRHARRGRRRPRRGRGGPVHRAHRQPPHGRGPQDARGRSARAGADGPGQRLLGPRQGRAAGGLLDHERRVHLPLRRRVRPHRGMGRESGAPSCRCPSQRINVPMQSRCWRGWTRPTRPAGSSGCRWPRAPSGWCWASGRPSSPSWPTPPTRSSTTSPSGSASPSSASPRSGPSSSRSVPTRSPAMAAPCRPWPTR